MLKKVDSMKFQERWGDILLPAEQHHYLVKTLGFKKVDSRCPVCYTLNMVLRNLEMHMNKNDKHKIENGEEHA